MDSQVKKCQNLLYLNRQKNNYIIKARLEDTALI